LCSGAANSTNLPFIPRRRDFGDKNGLRCHAAPLFSANRPILKLQSWTAAL
jgi:hypothetical protein